ncbi:Methylthioribulose-1-phosphate dehydratase [Raoultella planticola]|uniref:Methylthioribulose-1-phosphate dehydratase n=1 Tax=Raoultella planticola TaxID=575 RepID=A0A485CPD6_RAOPL|nr:Methylthioribulose-1-phosphate dehydratase [Raoultella planticola]
MAKKDSRNWSPPVIGSARKAGRRQPAAICRCVRMRPGAGLASRDRDKGSLTTEDFLQVEIASNKAPSGRKPSAETGLHTLVYRLFPEANVVLHVHTVNATVLSRIEKSATLALQGYEMQKTLTGQHSHLDTVPVAIFDNDQDIDALAARIGRLCADQPAALRLPAARPRPDLLGQRY